MSIHFTYAGVGYLHNLIIQRAYMETIPENMYMLQWKCYYDKQVFLSFVIVQQLNNIISLLLYYSFQYIYIILVFPAGNIIIERLVPPSNDAVEIITKKTNK